MGSDPFISAVIISKNEERNIRRCLESLAGIADEIIVVDSFSTDDTQEICQSFKNLRFVTMEWHGYSGTKNYGNSLARGKYILSLDADEALSPELRDSIMLLKKEDRYFECCSTNRLTRFCGKWIHHCGWYPDRKVRLWLNRTARWEGTIHERLVFDRKMSCIHLRGDLLHYSYDSLEAYRRKNRKYEDMLARDYADRKKSISLLKLWCSPLFKFISTYFLKGGFLDGREGWIICTTTAKGTYRKYARTRQISRDKNPD